MRRLGIALLMIGSVVGCRSGQDPEAPTEGDTAVSDETTTTTTTTAPTTTTLPAASTSSEQTSVSGAPYSWMPEWPAHAADEFVASAETELSQRYGEYTLDHNTGIVQLPNGVKIELGALAKTISARNVVGWRSAMITYFDHVDKIVERAGESFADAKAKLRIRLIAPEAAPTAADEAVTLDAVDGATGYLVYDDEAVYSFVKADQVKRWEQNEKAVLEIALEQTIGELKTGVRRSIVPEVDLLMIGQTPYGATVLLDPSALLPDGSNGGWIIAVPSSNVAIAMELDRANLDAVILMANFARRINSEQRSPLSTNLYWWKDGVTTTIRPAPGGYFATDKLEKLFAGNTADD